MKCESISFFKYPIGQINNTYTSINSIDYINELFNIWRTHGLIYSDIHFHPRDADWVLFKCGGVQTAQGGIHKFPSITLSNLQEKAEII